MPTHLTHKAEYLYPGTFFPEETSRTLTAPTLEAAIAAEPNDGWYKVIVTTTRKKVFRSYDGEERVLPVSGQPETVGSWMVGELFTYDEVAQLDGDHTILLRNMRGNGWDPICRTRRGNWQPVDPGCTVISPADLAAR